MLVLRTREINSDGEIGNPRFGQLQKSTAYGEPAWKLELEANFFLTLIAATCDKRKREENGSNVSGLLLLRLLTCERNNPRPEYSV